MATTKTYYMPKDDVGKARLLEHLAKHLPVHATALGLTENDLNEVKADAAAFAYTLSALETVQSNGKLWTAFKNQQRDGGSGGTAYPNLTNLPAPVPAVPLGIIPRLSNLVARIKAARGYSEAIGKDLNIVGTVQVMEIDEVKPIIEITTRGGHPIIQWSKGDADALEIWVDRNDDRGFGLFTIANSPRITDTTPVPATPVQWKYKAIYRLKDDRIGDWSTITPVAVGG